MDLINPSPEVFERKDTDRRAVSGLPDTAAKPPAYAVNQSIGLVARA